MFYDWCVKGWTFTQNKRMTFLNMYKTLNFKSILKKYIQNLSPPPKKKSVCEGFSQDIPNLRQLKYWHNTDSLVYIGLYSGYTHPSQLKYWYNTDSLVYIGLYSGYTHHSHLKYWYNTDSLVYIGLYSGYTHLSHLKYWYNTDSLVYIGLYSGFTHLSHLKAWHSVQHKDKKSWSEGFSYDIPGIKYSSSQIRVQNK
jgi:hypothetical protein